MKLSGIINIFVPGNDAFPFVSAAERWKSSFNSFCCRVQGGGIPENLVNKNCASILTQFSYFVILFP